MRSATQRTVLPSVGVAPVTLDQVTSGSPSGTPSGPVVSWICGKYLLATAVSGFIA